MQKATTMPQVYRMALNAILTAAIALLARTAPAANARNAYVSVSCSETAVSAVVVDGKDFYVATREMQDLWLNNPSGFCAVVESRIKALSSDRQDRETGTAALELLRDIAALQFPISGAERVFLPQKKDDLLLRCMGVPALRDEEETGRCLELALEIVRGQIVPGYQKKGLLNPCVGLGLSAEERRCLLLENKRNIESDRWQMALQDSEARLSIFMRHRQKRKQRP